MDADAVDLCPTLCREDHGRGLASDAPLSNSYRARTILAVPYSRKQHRCRTPSRRDGSVFASPRQCKFREPGYTGYWGPHKHAGRRPDLAPSPGVPLTVQDSPAAFVWVQIARRLTT